VVSEVTKQNVIFLHATMVTTKQQFFASGVQFLAPFNSGMCIVVSTMDVS
jgi:hypothetical protein